MQHDCLIGGHPINYLTLAFTGSFHNHQKINGPEGGFSNDLRETLCYGELLKHEFYPITVNFWNTNFTQKNFWISTQRALLYRHFMKLLE